MITIKIPTVQDFLIWLKVKKYVDAEKKTEANWKAVDDFYKAVLHHIDREPISQENKDYLVKVIKEEREKVRLYKVYPYKGMSYEYTNR